MGVFNLNSAYLTPRQATNGTIFYVDAGLNTSYPKAGTGWFDLSGNNNHLTAFNSPTFVQGSQETKNYFTLNGSTQYFTGAIGGLSNSGDLTLEGIFYFNSFQASRSWTILLGGTGTTGQIHWIQTNTGAAQYGIFGGAQVGFQLSLNRWYHVVQTFEGSAVRLYVDGRFIGSATGTRNFASTAVRIGLPSLSESYHNGRMSMFRVYNRALSNNEVPNNYNYFRGRYV